MIRKKIGPSGPEFSEFPTVCVLMDGDQDGGVADLVGAVGGAPRRRESGD